jgi:hypothetical protein
MTEGTMLSFVGAVTVFLILLGIKIWEDWTFVRHMVKTIEDRASDKGESNRAAD